jgi:glycosyltransferase involved in cell wall biosynthesis
MTRARAAFVMEQTLGHVTHYRNLRAVVGQHRDVVPTWLPVPFDVSGRARHVPLVRSNWSVRASWRARRALRRALVAQSHDAVVFHTQVTALFSLGVIRRVPAVVSLDATPINYDTVGYHYGHQAAGDGFLDRHKYRLNRAVFHAAAGLVTWSEWARRSLVIDYGVAPERVRVIAPGAADRYFHLGQYRLQGEPRPSQPGEHVQLLFVGGDFERKGGPLLLEVFRGALAERCELHLVTQADVVPSPNVYVHRALGPNSEELQRLFAEADVFVLPSRADCLAVALMEATASGLPIITTDVGALREAVYDGESGFLISPGDGRALHQTLTTLVDDAQRRERMGRAGHRLARQKFDAGRNGRALLDLVVEVAHVDKRGGRAA